MRDYFATPEARANYTRITAQIREQHWAALDELPAFLEVWHKTHGNTLVTATQLMQLADTHGMLQGILRPTRAVIRAGRLAKWLGSLGPVHPGADQWFIGISYAKQRRGPSWRLERVR